MKESVTGKIIGSSLPRVARSAGGGMILIGTGTLLGWTFTAGIGSRGLPLWAAMSPLSAIALVLLGVCLWRLAEAEETSAKTRDVVGLILAAVVAGFGVLEFAGYFLSLSFATGQPPGTAAALFSVPPNTAFCLICCGLALILCSLDMRRCLRGAQGMALVVGFIALLALLGYSYGVLPLYQVHAAMPMALTTAIGLALFSIGFLAAKPDRGLMSVLTSETTGGSLARRLLGLAIIIPWILGALLLAGEKRGHYGGEFGLAIFAALSIVIFTLLIWWNAKLLHYADIKREQAEEQLRDASANLERSNAELQQFASLASHDLSEPLRMVISYMQLLSSRYASKLDKQGQEFISFAVDGALRMQALIKDLLAYSRLGTRARPFEPVEMEDVLKSALSNLKVAIEETGAVVTHEPLPRVWGDPVRLTQIFQNLIGNAVKFHGTEPPRIQVRANRTEVEWRICVRDNGIGIDPKFFDRIFVIFQRLHTRQEYSGTGMGLAICKKIIEYHGGRIWVESAPGKGSTFCFTLPVEKPVMPGFY